jgi:hypothetical protein
MMDTPAAMRRHALPSGALSRGHPMEKRDGVWHRFFRGRWQVLVVTPMPPHERRASQTSRAKRIRNGETSPLPPTNDWKWMNVKSK